MKARLVVDIELRDQVMSAMNASVTDVLDDLSRAVALSLFKSHYVANASIERVEADALDVPIPPGTAAAREPAGDGDAPGDSSARPVPSEVEQLREWIERLSRGWRWSMNENDKLRRTISFFASVIKSGEPWTEHCQRELEAASARRDSSTGQCPGEVEQLREEVARLQPYAPPRPPRPAGGPQ